MGEGGGGLMYGWSVWAQASEVRYFGGTDDGQGFDDENEVSGSFLPFGGWVSVAVIGTGGG